MNKKLHNKFFLKKLLFVIVILCCCSMPCFATSFDLTQEKEVTLNMKNQSIKNYLKEIQKQTNLNFVYDETTLSSISPKTINVKNTKVNVVLEQLFSETGFTYQLNNNIITITKQVVKQQIQNQTKTPIRITGMVISKIDRKPVIGATITIIGDKGGAITDQDGKFILNSFIGAEIEISYLGMLPIKRKLTATDTDLLIEMEADVLAVDDVVITGMFRKSAESFTGSSVRITDKELKQFGNRNVLTTLRNIDPAFNIIESNDWGSDPNRLPEVIIRGTSSMPNVNQLQDETRANLNTPLVILDGFESTLQRLMDMNENEISSITILKDASATAMYGSRGANGVIVIETKVPIQGKLRISYRGDMNIEMPDLTSYSLLNARDKLDLEYITGVYNHTYAESDLRLKQQYNYLLNQVNKGLDTYWLAKPLRSGIGQRHNLRLEGGDNVFRYSAAAQINNIVGVMKKSNRRNFNGDITLSYRYKNLRFSNNTIIGLNNTKNSPYGSFSDYAKMNPYFSPYDADGKIIQIVGLEGPIAETRKNYGIANPLWNSTLNTYAKTNSLNVTNNFALDWDIIEGLQLRARIGVQKQVGGADEFYPAEHTMFANYSQDDILRKGQYVNANDNSNGYDVSLNLSYSRTFNDKHLLYAGVNLNARESNSTSTNIVGEGFTNEDLDFLPMALQYENGGKPSGSESRNRGVGAVGNFNYSYDNRYYVDLTLTGDGNSAFGSDNRFAMFWSTGIGWSLHNERFLKDNEVVNKLKIRASVGTNGSQMFNSYQTLTTYRYYTDSRYYTWTGADVSNLGNPSLKWQRKMNYNIGLETEFFNRRLQVMVDGYLETTKDQISSINIPTSTGFSSYIENIGKVENRGYEVKVTGLIIRDLKKEIVWSVTGSLAYNKNKIVELSQAMKEAQASLEADKSANPSQIYKEGYSMDQIYVVPSFGIDPSTGRELYRDINGNATFIWNAANLAPCGINAPAYRGNINTSVRWRSLLLSASFGYQFGGQIYNSTLIDKVENADYKYNVDSRVYTSRWQKPGDKAFFKSVFIKTATSKTSRFVQDEKLFKCQNVSLSYEFRQRFVKEKLRMENLSLQASMTDLFYMSSVQRERGTSYPFSRQMSLTLNVTF